MSFDYEWKDMPEIEGEEEDKRRSRGSFYAILKRVEGHRDFFNRAWKLQIRCGALFGQRAEMRFSWCKRPGGKWRFRPEC